MNDTTSKQTTSGRARRQFKGTDVTNLSIETNTGIYYLLAKVQGKCFRESLRTTSKTAAKEVLLKRLTEIREKLEQGVNLKSDLTVRDCADIWIRHQEAAREAGNLTTNYLLSVRWCLKKFWEIYPTGFGDLPIRKVSVEALKEPFIKYWRGDISATACNTVRRVICGIYEAAIERNALTQNLGKLLPNKLKRDRVTAIPTSEQLTLLLNDINRPESRNRWKHDIRDFVEFLCFTGARQNEARHVLVRDVDFARNRVHLRICKGSGGDESWARFVPIAPQALPLLQKLVKDKQPEDPLLCVHECRDTLENASLRLKLPHITHHTCRHIFTTRALESTNCNYFLVAAWLGHRDGGKLLARKYAHLNDAFSQKEIKKLTYHFAAEKPAPETINVGGRVYTAEQLEALLAQKAA